MKGKDIENEKRGCFMFKRILAMMMCACFLVGAAACNSKDAAGNNVAGNNATGSDVAGNDTGDAGVSDVVENKEETMLSEKQEEPEVPTISPEVSVVETPPAAMQLLKTVNLMEHVEPMGVDLDDLLPDCPVLKFGLPLFQSVLKEAESGENVLVSPLSAITALQMASIGANGKTKDQMNKVLGTDPLSSYMMYYAKNLPKGDGYKVNLANGIWFKNVESLHVQESFLKWNKQFYDAAAYAAPFNEDTLNEINTWVSDNTDGMIPGILEEIKEEDVMYLVNALSFDAEWKNIYYESDIWKDIFTTESGEEQLVPMMHSKESIYLEDDFATGVMKYYKDEKYAFVALLPKEGITLADYVEGLTAEQLKTLLKNPVYGPVETTLPKFSVGYDMKLNDILCSMGMPDAFSVGDADFSNMAVSDVGNIYINDVFQKTFIAVDERGTKAGAATAVAMANKALALNQKVVNLNRPFVYMIIECEYNEPLFFGAVMQVE